jgi:PAS domain S-box-containing protein
VKTIGAALPENVRGAVENPARLDALDRLDVSEEGPDSDFDRLTRTAAHVFGAEIAIVSLIGRDRQWFRSCFGADIEGTATDISFCAHTIAIPEDQRALVVMDATQDDRLATNELVTGWPGVRFYAGAPVVVAGQRVGSVCVIGLQPRDSLNAALLIQLEDLAGLASSLFNLKEEARIRARTAAALMQEEWRHALTLEAGKVGSWMWDMRTGEVTCNDMFRRMFGLRETGPVTAEQVFDAAPAAERSKIRAAMQASMQEGSDYSSEVRVISTGKWLSMRGRVYQRDAAGTPLIMMGASIDITDNKQSAEHTRLLLRELNHRVKNTLAMIQSVARQTIRQNPDPKAFIEAFSGRLRTISEAHVLLADRDWSYVQLYEVIGAQFGPQFLTKPDRAVITGDDVALPADHALGLGLILHELTTNAHRHGAWSDEKGIVCIDWEVEQEPVRGLRLHWKEHNGPTVAQPSDYGLGARLIERSLAKVLDSDVQLKFPPEGVDARIWMPLPSA